MYTTVNHTLNFVPDTVPTPRIAALFAFASVGVPVFPKPLETSNVWEARATVVPAGKLLIRCAFTIRNQQVAGSTPAGGSIVSASYPPYWLYAKDGGHPQVPEF